MVTTTTRTIIAAAALLLLGCTPEFKVDPNTFYPCDVGAHECISGYGCQIMPDPTVEDSLLDGPYISVCLQECASKTDCPGEDGAGWACVTGELLTPVDGDETGSCVPEVFVPLYGCSFEEIDGLVCECEFNADCILDADDETWCVEGVDGTNICTYACSNNGDCGEGGGPDQPPEYDCMNTGLNPDKGPEAVCLPPSSRSCQPCNVDDDCDFAGPEPPADAPARPDNRCIKWTDPFDNDVGTCGQGTKDGQCQPDTPALVEGLTTMEGETGVSQCFPTEDGPDGCGPISQTSENLGYAPPPG